MISESERGGKCRRQRGKGAQPGDAYRECLQHCERMFEVHVETVFSCLYRGNEGQRKVGSDEEIETKRGNSEIVMEW